VVRQVLPNHKQSESAKSLHQSLVALTIVSRRAVRLSQSGVSAKALHQVLLALKLSGKICLNSLLSELFMVIDEGALEGTTV